MKAYFAPSVIISYVMAVFYFRTVKVNELTQTHFSNTNYINALAQLVVFLGCVGRESFKARVTMLAPYEIRKT